MKLIMPWSSWAAMWQWNFIVRSGPEIVLARNAGEKGSLFGEVHGYDCAHLRAPEVVPMLLFTRGRAD
ncbi:hypothetical protein ACFVXG_39380 [Kitasatospora sp. NPDC058162]|uniref:hypothetical protein n=1 Tax=Kitasatospora sp. NPDC058162 TaxID=3346362 RepID=UPI0036D939FE